jgi:serine/threonine-protein kinase HipA
MKKLSVRYRAWDEDWPLGTLADDGATLLFEYTPEALAQGLELSPLHLKLQAPAYGGFPGFLHRLPGFIADSLPDGWGLLLMDRLFRQQGIAQPGPLERLAFIGDRAMGALAFEPASEMDAEADAGLPDWSLLALAEEARQMLQGKSGESIAILRELVLTGGSPHGARPKALVRYDRQNERISTCASASGEPWLVKFQGQGEHKEVCAIECLYAELARDCGLEMPATACFDLSPKLAAFGVARFDRQGEKRVPIHSLAGLLQVDFRLPGSADYTALLRATRFLTHDEREVDKAYARAVFNVLFHNRDDHPKNFAWRLGEDRRWRLAPAYDLTFSTGPGGQHHMDVCGEGSRIEREHLLRLAREGGVSAQTAREIIERISETASQVRQYAKNYPIRRATLKRMVEAIEGCRIAGSAGVPPASSSNHAGETPALPGG